MDPKKIVVTGVSRGLGRAMVDGFIQRGHAVAGCARNASAIHALSELYTSPHRFDHVDLGQEKEVFTWSHRVLTEFGTPDLLINNAAIINENAKLWDISNEEFSDVMNINIKGVFLVVKSFVPQMIQAKQGIIVNFSSGWGRSTAPDVAPYCATKWAIEGLTQSLAQELPKGLAAVPLNPGIINTEMLQSCFGESANDFPSAEQWAAKAVPFLLQLGTKDNGIPVSV